MSDVLSQKEIDYWIEASVNMSESDFEKEFLKLSPEKKSAVDTLIANIFFPATAEDDPSVKML